MTPLVWDILIHLMQGVDVEVDMEDMGAEVVLVLVEARV
jgi:hypothetical protein